MPSREFARMADVIPPADINTVRVSHFTLDRPPLRGLLHPREYISPGTYARLQVGGGVVMSDTDMERESNRDLARLARGRVLISGLGLGMVLTALLPLERVRAVTVLEKNADVIAAVCPALRRWLRAQPRGAWMDARLTVLHADAFDWTPPVRRRQFDTIYHDIWPDICADNLRDVRTLHKRYRAWLTKGGWQDSWMHDELRDLNHERRRSTWRWPTQNW